MQHEGNRHRAFEAFGLHRIGHLELLERLPHGDERGRIEPCVAAARIYERGADLASSRDLEMNDGRAIPALLTGFRWILDVAARSIGEAPQILVDLLSRARALYGCSGCRFDILGG